MSVESVYVGLQDDVALVRSAAARCLGRIALDKDRAIAALIRVLDDECSAVRNSATSSLLLFGHSAIGPLEDTINSREQPLRTRMYAVTALSRTPEFALLKLKVLIQALENWDPVISQYAMMGIGNICHSMHLQQDHVHPWLDSDEFSACVALVASVRDRISESLKTADRSTVDPRYVRVPIDKVIDRSTPSENDS